MLQSIRSALLVSATVLLPLSVTVRADTTSALANFKSTMGSWNVITTENFFTTSHVDGRLAVGGDAIFGNAVINMQGQDDSARALWVDGNIQGYAQVSGGGGAVVRNSTTNPGLNTFRPNPNQAALYDSDAYVVFNGNGSGNPDIVVNSTPSPFFSSVENTMQAVQNEFFGSAAASGPTKFDEDTIYFNATTAGVTVFNWNIDLLDAKKISEVGFNLGANSYAVINIVSDETNIWDAGFNFLGGSNDLASRILWNVAVGYINFSGSELHGSILAADADIISKKQLNGSIYAHSLVQLDQEIHNRPLSYNPPQNVPESSSVLVLALAGFAVGLAAWARRFLGVSAS